MNIVCGHGRVRGKQNLSVSTQGKKKRKGKQNPMDSIFWNRELDERNPVVAEQPPERESWMDGWTKVVSVAEAGGWVCVFGEY